MVAPDKQIFQGFGTAGTRILLYKTKVCLVIASVAGVIVAEIRYGVLTVVIIFVVLVGRVTSENDGFDSTAVRLNFPAKVQQRGSILPV